MSRSIKQQFNHAICETFREGESKHLYRQINGSTNYYSFSVQTNENLRATANQFSSWLKETHPEVKRVRDIQSNHVKEFFDAKSSNWSMKTCQGKLSDMRVLFGKCENVYGRMHSLNALSAPTPGHGSVRDVTMTREDANNLINSFKDRGSRSMGLRGVEIGTKTGLRVKEIAKLNTDRINLDKGVLEIRAGSKGGKWRDVPIKPQHMDYFRGLKEALGPNTMVCGGVQSSSIDKEIRREMSRLGIDQKYACTTEHAMRKLYAHERMAEERAKGLSERKAWEVVQMELGHGENFRTELYQIYVGR